MTFGLSILTFEDVSVMLGVWAFPLQLHNLQVYRYTVFGFLTGGALSFELAELVLDLSWARRHCLVAGFVLFQAAS